MTRALLLAACALTACAPGVGQLRPSLPILGPGPFTNLGDGDAALTNASAHVAWGAAVALGGLALGGRKGLRWACGAWGLGTLLQEGLFHAPEHPGPAYPAEVRTDLITRLLPCAVALAVSEGTR